MSLKLRLSLLFSALLALVMLAGAIYIVRGARDDVRAEIRSTSNLAVQLLDAQLDTLASNPNATAAPSFNLKKLGQVRHLKIEFYDAGGRLLDSNQEAGEARAAEIPQWFASMATLVSPDFQEIRRKVTYGGKPAGELVISPDPSFELEEAWTDSKELLQLSLLLFAGVNVMVYWVVRRALHSVDRMLAALAEMARGNLGARLPRFPLPELARLSSEFNRMADTLENSVNQNHRLSQQLIRVQEEEQKKLARELHDELGQCLSAIHADAVAILGHGDEFPPVKDGAQAIIAVSRQIADMVRTMLQRLRPETLDALGLEEALKELVAVWKQRNPHLHCALEMSGELRGLNDKINISAYRVVQESLTNAAKHSQATRVDIAIQRAQEGASDLLDLRIQDNGIGAADGKSGGGLGLLGMRERVEILGGTLAALNLPQGGFTIHVRLPLAAQENGTSEDGKADQSIAGG